jgi:ATP-dependent exoDNAse (exonuclease V) alpha subunit
MNNLLRTLPAGASLLLVGDVDQLPSVGPGMVLVQQHPVGRSWWQPWSHPAGGGKARVHREDSFLYDSESASGRIAQMNVS